jgi:DNA primase catalytic core
MDSLSAFKAFVEQVREQSDVVEIIGRDVALRQVGSALKGLSPFHPENHPSFVVWPRTQSWHDYSHGGGLGGDVFTYVQEREQLGFKEAVFWLADRAGIRRPNQDEASWTRALALADERRQIERLLTIAATYYHRALPPEIRDQYFKRRYGFTDETIDQLRLGWSDGRLFEHLTRTSGATHRALLGTGLFVPLKGGRVVDFYRNRLVFPYWRGGRVVYFTARATERTGDEPWEQAKYRKLRVHTEQQRYISPTVRNDYFFNEDAARDAEELVITEGIPDCISALQSGVACISPATTSLRTQDLARLLELTRSAKRIVVCNDAETSGAGDASATSIAASLWAGGCESCIASIPRPDGVDKVDLNDLVVAQGADGLHAVLAHALPYPAFLIERIPSDTAKSELGRLLEPVLTAIMRCPPIRADAFLDAIAAKFQLRRRSLLETVKRHEQRRAREAKPEAAPRARPSAPAIRGPTTVSGPTAGGPAGRSPRPEICVTGRHLHDLVVEAHDVLAVANQRRTARAATDNVEEDEMPLFRRGNMLARLERPEDEAPRLAEVSEPSMYGLIMREIDWVRDSEQGAVPVFPPDKVARDVLIHPRSTFARVNSVITAPAFGRDGDLLRTPGLHVRDRLWLEPDPSLQLPAVPAHPTPEDVAAARALFFDDLLVDFPFDGPSDRAHALAALLLPFLQRMIDGCTPLHVMEAPGVGSGKGLLCNLISILLTGAECATCTLPESDEEIRKMLTSELLMARPLVLLDNAKDMKAISSPALAAVLTSRSWTDRILGRSEMVTVPNKATWMLTGNNPKLSRDLARRSIRIRIDPKVDRPWLRAKFKHDPLEQWAKDHRSALVHGALVLVQAWIAAGRPLSRARLGSFQIWASTMGGLLDVIDVPGFLGNLDALYASSDDEQTAWREFTRVWWNTLGADQVRVSALLELCEKQELLSHVIGDGTTRAQQVRLGRALQRARDRIFGELQIVVGGTDRDSRTLYALHHVEPECAPTSPYDTRAVEVDPERREETHWVPYSDDDDDRGEAPE